MRKFLWICVVLVFMAACQSNTYGKKKPADLISRDTLVMALKDLSLIESHIQDKYVHVGVFKGLMKRSGEQVLKTYRLTPYRFEETMDYYGSHQLMLQSVYTQVLDSLNKEASKMPEDSFRAPDSTGLPNLPGFPGRP